MFIRYDWTIEELKKLEAMPLLALISKSHGLHVQFHKPGEIQVCTLISVKTGGCPEDCKYCAQSSMHSDLRQDGWLPRRLQILCAVVALSNSRFRTAHDAVCKGLKRS
jgi:biotin synthase-like enzyme